MAGDFPWRKWDEQNPWMPEKQNPWPEPTRDDYRDKLVQELLHLLRKTQKAQEDALGLLMIGSDGKLYIRLSDGEEILLESIDDIKKIKTKKLLKNKPACDCDISKTYS